MQQGSRVPGCFTKVQYPCQVKEVLAGQKYTAHTAVMLCWPPESKMSSPKHSFQLYFEVREHISPHLCLAASPKRHQELFWVVRVAMPNLGKKQVKVAAALDAANKRHRLPHAPCCSRQCHCVNSDAALPKVQSHTFQLHSVHSRGNIQKHLPSQDSPHPPASRTLASRE